METKESFFQNIPIFNREKIWINLSIAILVVMAGTVIGWLINSNTLSIGSSKKTTSNSVTNTTNEAGFTDQKTFKDNATGILEEGGIEGEGTHHLNRGLGANKDVYLNSTVVDLQSFVGKKVEVWGETVKGKKAGWLMDVGRVKVVN